MQTRGSTMTNQQQQKQQPMDETRTMQPDEKEQQDDQMDQIMNDSSTENEELKTPAKAPRIPKDDEDCFKTCKTEMPVGGGARRQLRMTPARNSILSGNQPFKEVNSSSKKFNKRRRLNRSGLNGSKLNETAGSHETFVAHEQELLFDRDSLDTHPPSARRMRISSTPKPCFERVQPTDVRPKPPAPVQSEIKKMAPPKPRIVESRVKAARPKPNPMIESRFKEPRPQQRAFNRFVTPRSNNFSTRYCESAKSSVFKRPSMSAGPLTRTQSFKSTAELERDYINSLRSRI